MGRRPKSIKLQLLEGNKNRLTKKEIEQRVKNEEKLTVGKNKVRPPTWLSEVEKKYFRELVKELKAIDLLTNVDVIALARYVNAYNEYVQCNEIIATEGLMVEYTNKAAETNKVPHPLLTKKKAAHEMMKALEGEFGLTPSARAKLAIVDREEKPQKTEAERRFGDRL